MSEKKMTINKSAAAAFVYGFEIADRRNRLRWQPPHILYPDSCLKSAGSVLRSQFLSDVHCFFRITSDLQSDNKVNVKVRCPSKMKAITDYLYGHRAKYSEMHDKKESSWKRSQSTNYQLLPDYSPPTNKDRKDGSISSSDTAVATETGIFASFSSTSSTPEIPHSPVLSKWGRLTLPVPQFSRNDFSVWSILKQCIGKELSKITMPVVFNEPLSFLQRLSENTEYYYLLEKANMSDDPVNRLEYVSAFAVACISSNWERLGKPFNPLLGETYELVKEGFRIVTEQVSHHPPVTAFHADSSHFVFTGAIHPKLKLWARSVEIKPEGTVILKLLKHNETYTWTGVTSCVHNIIVGKLWMEQCGTMEIQCHTNGLVAELNFKPAGWYSKDLNCVEGFLYDRQKTKLRFIHGKWCSFIKSSDPHLYDEYLRLKDQKTQNTGTSGSSKENSNLLHYSKNQRKKSLSSSVDNGDTTEFRTLDDLPSVLLWEADPRPDYCSEYYNFTLYAMALNELPEEMKSILPPTDSRLRPDIRKLEEGDVDGAAFEKNRLEEKQREARKIRKKEKITFEPLYFTSKPHPYAKEESWSYKGGYWDRNFSNSPDIF